MFPVIPPDTHPVRLINLREVSGGKSTLPIRFINALENCGYVLVSDGKTRQSLERYAYHDSYVMVPPDHPQFDYLYKWMEQAGHLAYLHTQVLNRLSYIAVHKYPVRTLRKEWNFLANMLAKYPTSKGGLLSDTTPTPEQLLSQDIKDEYESIIAQGLLMPEINYHNTVVHSSNIDPVLNF